MEKPFPVDPRQINKIPEYTVRKLQIEIEVILNVVIITMMVLTAD